MKTVFLLYGVSKNVCLELAQENPLEFFNHALESIVPALFDLNHEVSEPDPDVCVDVFEVLVYLMLHRLYSLLVQIKQTLRLDFFLLATSVSEILDHFSNIYCQCFRLILEQQAVFYKRAVHHCKDALLNMLQLFLLLDDLERVLQGVVAFFVQSVQKERFEVHHKLGGFNVCVNYCSVQGIVIPVSML